MKHKNRRVQSFLFFLIYRIISTHFSGLEFKFGIYSNSLLQNGLTFNFWLVRYLQFIEFSIFVLTLLFLMFWWSDFSEFSLVTSVMVLAPVLSCSPYVLRLFAQYYAILSLFISFTTMMYREFLASFFFIDTNEKP